MYGSSTIYNMQNDIVRIRLQFYHKHLHRAVLNRGRCLKMGEVGAYFKVTEVIQMKFQNFVIVSFQVGIYNLYIPELRVIFIICLFVYSCTLIQLQLDYGHISN